MTERRPGEWPAGLRPVPAAASTPEETPQPLQGPPVVVPVPEVRLVVTVDLTGHFATWDEVSEELRQQTQRNVDCHTAVVRLGPDAIRHGLFLPHAIAGVFYLSAKQIHVEVPAGSPMAAALGEQVARDVARMVRDHQAHLLSLRTPG